MNHSKNYEAVDVPQNKNKTFFATPNGGESLFSAHRKKNRD